MAIPPKTVAAPLVRMEVDLAVATGVARDAILDAMGLSTNALERDDARIPIEHDIAFWERIADISGDDAWGLHAGDFAARYQVDMGSLDWLRYAMRTSATSFDSLNRLARYNRLLQSEQLDCQLCRVGDEARVEVSVLVRQDADASQFFEFFFALFVGIGRSFLEGAYIKPKYVALTHPCRGASEERERVLDCPVRFSETANLIAWETSRIEEPLPSADPKLSALLDSHLDEILRNLPSASTLIEAVRAVLVRELASGPPSIGQVAKRMAMSSRTLQRRLADEGVVFSDLVDRTRRQLAERHLSSGAMTASEVAFVLGFSEPSAFHRAFRRWTGTTISVWRGASDAPIS